MITVNNMLEFLDYFHDYYTEENDLYSAYSDSIKRISQTNNRNRQEISEGCRRKLGLDNLKQFQDLLKDWTDNDSEDLIKALKNNSASPAHNIIDDFFEKHSFNGNGKSEPETKQQSKSRSKPCSAGKYCIEIDSETAKKISILTILDDKPVSDLLTGIVTARANERLKKWAQQIIDE